MTTDEYIPFTKPTISKEAIQEVVDCLESGWLATGPRTQKFENLLAEYFGVPCVQSCISATAGLLMVLESIDLQPGDEVITTPMTFAATANTIVLAGGTPVMVDVEPETYNIDPKCVEKAITKRTKAIMPVHFAGLPVDLDAIYGLASKHGLRVIEDVAHAMGGSYKGKKLGSFGDTQVFSFHPNKNMTTGEGGAIVTRDEKMRKHINYLRFHGIDRESWNRFAKGGSQLYDIVLPGYKFNFMDIQAALGIHQLAALDGFNAKRKELAERYYSLLKDFSELSLPVQPSYDHLHAWHLFTPLINEEKAGVTRDEFIEEMKKHNIGIGLHYQAIHLHSYYRKTYGYKEGDFPHAEFISDRIFSLPLFPKMTHSDQDRVVGAMAKVFRK
ncbi:MAG: UDP-4-amino-4,6-dideoxy-N-acetyl-beta-L-altrosamine transaminase [Verrucomicrobia bacterium GWC2_42_7]|nr:MAG: UDP-4-amino-4,6-dideoxy-N-acetyl-beta-L-altrosamine transaminase [Verrucomicrobia bacterium GWC2_42_7]